MSETTTLRAWSATLLAAAVLLFAGLATAAEPPEVPDGAFASGAEEEGNPRVEARLLFDAQNVTAGESFRVGVLFTIDPDWHIYWRNSGDSGMATDVRWKSDLASFGDLQWPAPHVYEEPSGEIITFGYGEEVMLLSEAKVDPDAEGELTVSAGVNYLACKRDCIPGSAELERTIEVGEPEAGRTASAGGVSELFGRWQSKVPKRPEDIGIAAEVVYSQKPIRPGDTVEAAVGFDYCDGDPQNCQPFEVAGDVPVYRFIPDTTTQIDWKTKSVRPHPSSKKGQVLVLEGTASPNKPSEEERFSGVVHLTDSDGKRHAVLVEAPIARAGSDAEIEKLEPALLSVAEPTAPEQTPDSSDKQTDKKGAPMGLAQALLFALIGGLILNLMPCVFPVLALKVTSFAELVHEDRRHKLLHGLAYTAGIVGSLLMLALVVIGLQAAGTKVGWGFQFQNPLFPAILSAVVVIFALNLFGVFEIGVSPNAIASKTREASGLQRSVGEGILAVVLATPCSAPFLGTAVGFALTGGAVTILAVFTALGLGLAAPFVILTMVPGMSQMLPRPGDWMVHLKKFLGFALIGAAIWLVWIVGRSAGVDAMARVLIFLTACGLGTWVYGQTQGKQSMTARAFVALALVGVAVVGFWGLRFDGRGAREAVAAHSEEGGIGWEPWSEERVQQELDKGRAVFVDFTADWCITCKVNERTVLSTSRVLKEIERRNVATLKADWTDGDESIRLKLEEFGKAGVPMYLVYSPARPDDPQMLSEVLTPSSVVEALREADETES